MYLPSISLATAFLAATSSAAPLPTPVPTTYGFGQNAIVRALPYLDTKPPLWMAKRALEGDQEDVNNPMFQESTYSSLWPRRNKFDWTASLDLASTLAPASSTGVVSAESDSPSISSASALISARRYTPKMEDHPLPTPPISSASALISARRSTPKMEEIVPPLEHILLKPKEYLQPSSASISSASALISAPPSSSTSAVISARSMTLTAYGPYGLPPPNDPGAIETPTSTSSPYPTNLIPLHCKDQKGTLSFVVGGSECVPWEGQQECTPPEVCNENKSDTEKEGVEKRSTSTSTSSPSLTDQEDTCDGCFTLPYCDTGKRGKLIIDSDGHFDRIEWQGIPEEEQECLAPEVCDVDKEAIENEAIETSEATETSEVTETNEATEQNENKEEMEKRRVPLLDDFYDAIHPPCVPGLHCEDWDKYDDDGWECGTPGARC